ncbi:MAG: serine/threonine protein kinase [Myxococcales bacterium]|nr:serine/threonine protein kinase [Myxococcales bacterium]
MQAAASPFGRYVLKARIARGGMGEVFLASAVGADGFEKRVVVKRVLPSLAGSRGFEQLFAAEARLMTRLEHPNIVQVFDYGRGSLGDAFLVMELVDGADLRSFQKAWRERHGEFPLGYASFIMQQVLRGLEFAHSKVELVHRDVSPGNVLLSRLGEVKVADFGVAQVELVDGVELVGKAAYVSPEQVSGGEVDLKSDLFAVGVMLYELVTGELPYDGRERSRPPRPPAGIRKDLPQAFEALILRCLAPDPDERPVSAREVSRELGRLGIAVVQPDELGDAVDELFPDEIRGETLLGRGPQGEQPLTELRRGEKGLDWAPDALSVVRRTGAIDTDWKTEALDDDPAPRPAEPRSDSSDSTDSSPHPRTILQERVETESPRQLKSRRPLLLGLGVSVILLGAFAVVYLTRAPEPRETPGEATSAPASASALASSLPETPARSSTLASESATPPPAPAGAAADRLAAGASAAANATSPGPASSTKQPTDAVTCSGSIQIFSNGSWLVSGGPRAVQSPGRYVWPCGRYDVSAVSRMDSSLRKAGSVLIRDGKTSTLDLR